MRRVEITLTVSFDYDLDDMEQHGARTDDDALKEDALEAFYECSPAVTIKRYEVEEKPKTECRHCGRPIAADGDKWVDPEATGDDRVWRETCDKNDTFTAEHEPDAKWVDLFGIDPTFDEPAKTPQQVPQGTHNHCKAVTCYNRIQFINVCSRCNGPTTPCRGKEDGCAA